jgi:fluoride exporter
MLSRPLPVLGGRMAETLWIAAGGALGSMARYWIAIWAVPISRELPWGTILINVAGSFAIGFFGALTIENGRFPLPPPVRLFFMVGVCGGFTTFSSFSLQTLDLLRSGAPGRAFLNIVVSVLLCLAAVAVGYTAGSHLSGRHQIAESAPEELAS